MAKNRLISELAGEGEQERRTDTDLYVKMTRWRISIYQEGTIDFEQFKAAFGRELREATPEYAETIKAWAQLVCLNKFHTEDTPHPEVI